MLITMNLINEEAETLPVGTLLDLTAYSTAEPAAMLVVIHLNIWTPSASFISKRFCIVQLQVHTSQVEEYPENGSSLHLRPVFVAPVLRDWHLNDGGMMCEHSMCKPTVQISLS